MDAGELTRYRVRSMSTFISRSRCTESGLRTWALQQATNTVYKTPNSALSTIADPCMPCNSITSSNNSAPLTEILTNTRMGFGGDYTTAIPPFSGDPATAIKESEYNFYRLPYVLPGCPIPYMSSNYLSACMSLPNFQGTSGALSTVNGNRTFCVENGSTCCVKYPFPNAP